MDKPMRRSDRQLTDEETLQLFRDAEYGVMSVTDENNMPYGVPMSFALSDNVIYFHCSAVGGKRISGTYDEDKLPTFIGLPEDQVLTAIIALGYAADTPDSPKRKGVDKLLRYI